MLVLIVFSSWKGEVVVAVQFAIDQMKFKHTFDLSW